MSAVLAAARRVKWEQRAYWRNPAAAGFTFAFPLLFLVVFTAINGNGRIPVSGGVVRFSQYYVPAITVFGLISACYTNLAIAITIRRENGLLKRTRGTPLPPGSYLAGMCGSSIVISLLLTTLVLVLGLTVYGVTFPGRYLGLVITVALGAFCFSALGIAISTLVPNEEAAPAVVNLVIFPLLFISGTFGRIQEGSTLAAIADVFPIRHLNELMVAVFNPFAEGNGLALRNVMFVVGWGVLGVLVALWRFRWEPRAKG